MRFAYHPSMCDPSFYLELGKAAEEAGFDVTAAIAGITLKGSKKGTPSRNSLLPSSL